MDRTAGLSRGQSSCGLTWVRCWASLTLCRVRSLDGRLQAVRGRSGRRPNSGTERRHTPAPARALL